ncbi:MAG: hypothetical protein LBV00_02495 [Propionibacteriaceae bacterium]|nr:hypothetical protein [Propionibacteriaceae bacterium]
MSWTHFVATSVLRVSATVSVIMRMLTLPVEETRSHFSETVEAVVGSLEWYDEADVRQAMRRD